MSASYHDAGTRTSRRSSSCSCAGCRPTATGCWPPGSARRCELIRELRFGEARARLPALARPFARRLPRLPRASFASRGDVEAMPEGTLCFANEPLLRVTAPRIEAQLLETLLLNQVNFQTMVATKAARVVLAAGGGEPGAGERVIDFSPRRDHGIDAAMKVARSAAVAGCGGTSNVAAAMRYGLRPVGTMAHSYVLSFDTRAGGVPRLPRGLPREQRAPRGHLRHARGRAPRDRGRRARPDVALRGVRLDSGDLLELSRAARRLLDEAGMTRDADRRQRRPRGGPDRRAGRRRRADRPLGRRHRPRHEPRLAGRQRRLQAGRRQHGRRVARRPKLSADKATLPGPKQVFRRSERDGTMERRRDRRRGRGARRRAAAGAGDARRRDRAPRDPSRRCASASAAELAALPAGLRRPASAEAPSPTR